MRDVELLRGAVPLAGADHRARAARRRRLSCALSATFATSRVTRARCRSRTASSTSSFSNAVIEHVGGRERQRQLVSEAIRVGRRVFITTPNRRFPVEVHTRLPLVHWLPDAISHRRLRRHRSGGRQRDRPADPGKLRGALPRSGSRRQPRADTGGDRRLARGGSPGSRSRSSSSGSCSTTPSWRSSGTSGFAGRRSTSSRPGRRRFSSSPSWWSRGTCVTSRPSRPRTSSRSPTRS